MSNEVLTQVKNGTLKDRIRETPVDQFQRRIRRIASIVGLIVTLILLWVYS